MNDKKERLVDIILEIEKYLYDQGIKAENIEINTEFSYDSIPSLSINIDGALRY